MVSALQSKTREAIAASLKAMELSPDDTAMIKIKLAHGYLFDNQFDKAKTIYLENKNAKLRDGKRNFSQAALDDFKECQDAGITHPDMEKIKALLTRNGGTVIKGKLYEETVEEDGSKGVGVTFNEKKVVVILL